MTITYPLDLPSAPSAPAEIRIFPMSAVAVSRSPFTLREQVQVHQGQLWQAEVTLPRMDGDAAAAWQAWLLSLNGREGTFRMGDPGRRVPRGLGTGSPQIDGAGQSGNTVQIDGFTPSKAGILLAGDYIQIGDRLHMVLEDANSDSSGEVTLSIWPRLREEPVNNSPVIVNNPTGLWRLATNEMPWTTRPPVRVSITFSAVEAL